MSLLCVPTPCVEILEVASKAFERAWRMWVASPSVESLHLMSAKKVELMESIEAVCDPSFEESPPIFTEHDEQLMKAFRNLFVEAKNLHEVWLQMPKDDPFVEAIYTCEELMHRG